MTHFHGEKPARWVNILLIWKRKERKKCVAIFMFNTFLTDWLIDSNLVKAWCSIKLLATKIDEHFPKLVDKCSARRDLSEHRFKAIARAIYVNAVKFTRDIPMTTIKRQIWLWLELSCRGTLHTVCGGNFNTGIGWMKEPWCVVYFKTPFPVLVQPQGEYTTCIVVVLNIIW